MDNDSLARTNMNLFYTLDAILNSATLTEAAQRANLTQPAISMALKKARAHFNDDIIVEAAGKRQLTPLAEALRPRIRNALRNAQQILDFSLEFDPAVTRRTVRISMPDYIEVLMLPHIVRAVRNTAPYLDVFVVPFDHEPIERQFEKDIDFAILPAALSDATFGYRPLFTERLALIVAADNPFAKADMITAEQFVDSHHAGLLARADMLAPAQGTVADLLKRRKIVVRTQTYTALPRMVVDNDLIVTISERYGQYCASIMDVRPIAFPIETDEVQIALQWQPFRENEPFVQWFAMLVETAAATSI